MPCVCVWPDERGYLYMYRSRGAWGGGMMGIDMCKSYYVLKACWKDFNVPVRTCTCVELFWCCTSFCVILLLMKNSGGERMHCSYRECILSPTDFDVGSECWNIVCTHIGWLWSNPMTCWVLIVHAIDWVLIIIALLFLFLQYRHLGGEELQDCNW